jgi:hypothetical protein
MLRWCLFAFVLAPALLPSLGCGSSSGTPRGGGAAPPNDGRVPDSGVCTEEASSPCTPCKSDYDCLDVGGLNYCTLTTGICQLFSCRGDSDCPPMEICTMDGYCADRADPQACSGMSCNYTTTAKCPGAVCNYALGVYY